MKVYLASAFRLIPLVELVAARLEAAGHTIAVKWWAADGFDLRDKKADNDHPDVFYTDPVCRWIFDRDFNGVRQADVLVIVAGPEPRAFNGANVEYGIALAFGKPCFALGRLDNSAMYFPVQRCGSIEELLRKIWELP